MVSLSLATVALFYGSKLGESWLLLISAREQSGSERYWGELLSVRYRNYSLEEINPGENLEVV